MAEAHIIGHDIDSDYGSEGSDVVSLLFVVFMMAECFENVDDGMAIKNLSHSRMYLIRNYFLI